MKVVSLDWGHKDSSVRVFDGKKITNKMPPVSSDLVIATENMPARQAKPYLDAGSKVFRCSTHQTKKYRLARGIPKTVGNPAHDEDAKIIYELYRDQPDQFYEFKINPVYAEFNALYGTYKGFQDLRVQIGNKLWACPESEVLQNEYAYVEAREDAVLRQIKDRLKKMPIWTDHLSKVRGIGEATAAGLLAYTGDINRFETFACFCSYFGLGVVDGKAPRKRAGEQANWHHKGRALMLGVIGDAFVKQKARIQKFGPNKVEVELPDGPFRAMYERVKAKHLLLVDKPIQAERRARRAIIKVFLKKFFQAYKKLCC